MGPGAIFFLNHFRVGSTWSSVKMFGVLLPSSSSFAFVDFYNQNFSHYLWKFSRPSIYHTYRFLLYFLHGAKKEGTKETEKYLGSKNVHSNNNSIAELSLSAELIIRESAESQALVGWISNWDKYLDNLLSSIELIESSVKCWEKCWVEYSVFWVKCWANIAVINDIWTKCLLSWSLLKLLHWVLSYSSIYILFYN